MKRFSILLLAFIFVSIQFSCEFIEKQQENNKGNTTDQISSKDTDVEKEEPVPVDVPQSNFTYGIDISHFQGDEIDFLNKKTDDLLFVICKATEGVTYTDPDFRNNWKTISEKGFIKGAYHFYRTNDNPIHQAENYLNAIADLDKLNLPPIVDLEEGGIDKSQSVDDIQKNLLIFLERIEKKWDRTPIIYTDKSTGDTYLNNSTFSKYPLWIAAYNKEASPSLPIAWKDGKYIFWQKSESYLVDGEKNDFDQFNGSEEDLLDFISGN